MAQGIQRGSMLAGIGAWSGGPVWGLGIWDWGLALGSGLSWKTSSSVVAWVEGDFARPIVEVVAWERDIDSGVA
jgi:hypothetical protein